MYTITSVRSTVITTVNSVMLILFKYVLDKLGNDTLIKKWKEITLFKKNNLPQKKFA